jgi:hypothetical protein
MMHDSTKKTRFFFHPEIGGGLAPERGSLDKLQINRNFAVYVFKKEERFLSESETKSCFAQEMEDMSKEISTAFLLTLIELSQFFTNYKDSVTKSFRRFF